MTQKNDDIFKLRNLAIEKEQARENVKNDISETKERLRPSNLIQEAKHKAMERVQKTGESALQGVKDNPGKVATVAAAAALLALRKPVTNYLANRTADNDGARNNDAEE
ncbi:hypothetical protein [Parasphingorhabdus cellanae]|uniref:DUF3618 domain-containing protein n=1 Tax=Parasphingorhabdus cellanae TaxID=2806553 RepID=A0ABX7T3R5_9SPHN|nr:hypothetical protein [Parasphingorhabdus cellanae]QTD56176.1 hypothetical protein J4G78_00775 [Parasphingorhabdus cellanae]